MKKIEDIPSEKDIEEAGMLIFESMKRCIVEILKIQMEFKLGPRNETINKDLAASFCALLDWSEK